jgi:hypothetical protein
MRYAVILFAAFMLSACLPSEGVQKLEAAEAVAEREIQEISRYGVRRLCDLPGNNLSEASNSLNLAIAMFFACPEVKNLVMNTIQAMSQMGISIVPDRGGE